MVALTKRQEAILRHIAKEINLHGTQPSIRDLCKRFRIRSPNGVQSHILALRRKGIIYGRSGARAIRFNWRSFL